MMTPMQRLMQTTAWFHAHARGFTPSVEDAQAADLALCLLPRDLRHSALAIMRYNGDPRARSYRTVANTLRRRGYAFEQAVVAARAAVVLKAFLRENWLWSYPGLSQP